MDKQIELAKSWFSLAQIFATIAGFLMVAFAAAIGLMGSLVLTGVQAIGQMDWNSKHTVNISGPICNFVKATGDAGTSSISLANMLFISAMIFGFAALVFWMVGHYKLSRIKV